MQGNSIDAICLVFCCVFTVLCETLMAMQNAVNVLAGTSAVTPVNHFAVRFLPLPFDVVVEVIFDVCISSPMYLT